MVERWHRTLKTSIRSHQTNDWCSILPLVLLGLRASIKEDINASPAEMLFGAPIRVPGEFFHAIDIAENNSEFIKQLRRKVQSLLPNEASRHSAGKTFIHSDLDSCKYVFVRNDHVCAPLQPPYEGHFEVVAKKEKNFKVNIRGRTVCVSIDRLKPAYIAGHGTTKYTTANHIKPQSIAPHETSSEPTSEGSGIESSSETVPDPPNCNPECDKNKVTRSGRHFQFPARYL
ncbi:uncharacterized protein LOC142226405 [Haematobia irritans]|uniref:uncharacterized protein LOC142226405 n=1 Tax=Haematobia irritans TaxID=7368 RepID=UPI003F500B65